MIAKVDLLIIIILLITVISLIYFKVMNKIEEHANFIENKIDNKINLQNKNIEKFIVADAQDFHNYNQHKEDVKDLRNNLVDDRMKNPDTDETVNYDKALDDDFYMGMTYYKKPWKYRTFPSKKFLNASDFGWDRPFQTVSCANSSIQNRYTTGPKKLMPFQIACEKPNKLTAENYYRTHYQAQPIPIEDMAVRGANYNDYSDYVHPTKSDIKILSYNTKGLPPDATKYKNIPIGYNYAFHNTPAMRMP